MEITTIFDSDREEYEYMQEQIDEKNCKECLHFEACCKWTDFPKQIGFPVCRKYRKQSEGEWVETDYKTFEHGFVERRGKAWKCTNCLHASKRFDNHMNFCPNCGAHMKGGAE